MNSPAKVWTTSERSADRDHHSGQAMSSDTGKYAPESLTELIDALERATENAGKGEQTAVEKSLQLMGLLKQIKVPNVANRTDDVSVFKPTVQPDQT